MQKTIILFKQDLRLADNPALYHGVKDGAIIPVYILDEINLTKMGGASKWWLYHSLLSLKKSLQKEDADIILAKGDTIKELEVIIKNSGANAIYFNNLYDPKSVLLETKIAEYFTKKKILVKSFNGNLLFDPRKIRNKQGGYFKVFTPFWKSLSIKLDDIEVLPNPDFKNKTLKNIANLSLDIKKLELLPKDYNWADKLNQYWQVGEEAAFAKLIYFLENIICFYKNGRDIPAKAATSSLSPYLHFGEISVRHIVSLTKMKMEIGDLAKGASINDIERFFSELGWREFSNHLLYHFPKLISEPFNPRFSKFTWEDNKKLLKKWQLGKTGYPIVDAGMRELWETGYMHNRVRMVVASFLTKHLLINWQYGAEWFFDTLVDADIPNNISSWQWVAGSGADAAPYFRIFNPILQGERFDPHGEYIKKWLPVLKDLPTKFIHAPWTAGDIELKMANITLGKNYPKPLVEHSEARDKAMALYKKL